MRKILIVLLAGCVALVVGCHLPGIRGNGQIKTEERPIAAFVNLDAERRLSRLSGKTDRPLFESRRTKICCLTLRTMFRSDTLHLRSREHVWPTHGIKVVISSPTRAGGKIRGAVKLTVKQLSGPIFALESKGASEVSLDGSVDRLLVDMTGASQLAAAGLQAKTAEISTTGAGDAEVAVTDTLKVVITGAGKVTYSGNPPTIKKQITGAGSIRHKD